MGNNPISTTGAIAIVTALNENENTLMEELHLTVSTQWNEKVVGRNA